MIESVQARHRGAFNFEDHYDSLCALQDSAPLPAVKAHLAEGVLDLNGDRIRLSDWQPIINSVKINKSLQFIAVRSCYQVPAVDDEKRPAVLRRKLPAIRSKEITHRLVKALRECLCVSPTLACIELQGLALRDRDLQVLMKGILKSQTLRHLSLECCRIGDLGLEVLCKGLKNTKHINSVNLSGCSLTLRGAESLAAVIKHQGMQRHNEAWQDSLRYRRPDLDRMSGIRRITANNNPLLGDDGARLLADALKDDLWLKALDLQACGIGIIGAKSFLEVLKYNTTLVVLDLRRNPLIGRDLLHSVMEQLMLNSNGEEREYAWMKAEEPEDCGVKQPAKTRRRATRVLNSSKGKKTSIKSTGGNNSCSCCGRVTPTSGRRKTRTSGAMSRKSEIQPSPGLPWRTAARANRFRGHPPETRKFLTDGSDDNDESIVIYLPDGDNNVNASSGFVGCDPVFDSVSNTRLKHVTAEAAAASEKLEKSHMSLDLTNQKEVLSELEHMRRLLTEERLARVRADQKVISLTIENRRLTEEIMLLHKGSKSNGGVAEDESFLDYVEASFKQFHAFIDLLREAGLGQLVTMAGLDQAHMPIIDGNTNGNTFLGNVPPHASDSSSKIGGGRNGLSVSASKTLNTKHAQSAPVMSVAPADGQQKLIGRTVSLPSSSVAFPKESSFATRQEIMQSPTLESAVYDVESEIARQEADELYSRLVKEARVAIGHQPEANGRRATFTRSGVTVDSGTHVLTELTSGKHLSGQNESEETVRQSTEDIHEDPSNNHVSGKGESGANDDDSENFREPLLQSIEGENLMSNNGARAFGSSYEFDDSKEDDF